MRRFALFIASLFFMGGVLAVALPAVPVWAVGENVIEDACKSGNASDSPLCNTNTDDPLTGPNGVILKIARIIAIIAGIAAVIVIMISGLSYMTADGDTQKAANARKMLIGAVVGLAIIALSSVIINFVINGIF